ncbi:MAG: hypothetical protein QOE11_3142 [Solirubrobacteraceae bacterium]|jgi:hypothetical protein|nr:hypothetical protein [Solirubrobacteraceae bacterium]
MRRTQGLAAVALTALAMLGFADAAMAAVAFTVVDDRGIDQFSAYRLPGAFSFLRTDGDGRFSANVVAGDVISVSRAPSSTGACAAPEGSSGLDYTVTAAASQTITLPNTTGDSTHTTLTDTESWIVGRLNEERAAHSPSLPALHVSTTLTQAAYAIAHDRVLAAGHAYPPPYCLVNLIDWGWPSAGFLNEDSPFAAPEQTLGHWDGTTDAESVNLAQNGVFDPANTAIGVADGGGYWIVEYNDCSASSVAPAFAGRCGMTTATGDPTAYTPPAPPAPPAPGGAAAGGDVPAAGATAPVGSAPAGQAPAGPSPGAPARDVAPPTVTLSGAARQGPAGPVAVAVTCLSEACTVDARGSVRVPAVRTVRAKTYSLAHVHRSLAKGTRATLRLTLPASARRAIHRALAAGRHVAVSIRLTVADAAGNVTTRTRRIRLELRHPVSAMVERTDCTCHVI